MTETLPAAAETLPQYARQVLVCLSDPASPLAEAFRQLRTSIQYSSPEHPVRTILATCTRTDEGKTATLANLAITLAQADRKVVLVDCDLRRPSLHHLFGVDNSKGLSTVLLNGTEQELPLQECGVPGLRLLPSGPPPPNPAELLGSQRMTEVVERLSSQNDYVLFDTPPVIAVADAAVLAPGMDGVLLVLKAGKTKRDMAQRAKAILQKVNAHVLGVVLNNVKYDVGAQSYYANQRRSHA